jgi:hypothetical protein
MATCEGSLLFSHLRSTHVTETSEAQNQPEQPERPEQPQQPEQPDIAAPSKRPSRKSVLALSIFALGFNAAAAVCTFSPPSFDLPNFGGLAELLPHQKVADPIPDPVVAALKDIQSAQQQHAASLQENSSSLQQNSALLQQDATTLAALRSSITDEQVDVKKISVDVKKMSAQISTLIAKVDSLQSSMTPEVTSSISAAHARHRPSMVARKKAAWPTKPVGPVSVGGSPLSYPVAAPAPES